MKVENVVKLLAGAAGACASFLFGGWSAALGTLFFFVAADYLTGIAAAGSKGELFSKAGMKGISKKVFIFLLVAVAHHVDLYLGAGSTFRDGTVVFFVANEALSILENAGRMGVPIPPKFAEMLQQLNGKGKSQ